MPGEVSVGDQLRARGRKSDDGLHVDADEIVFGRFLTKAGNIVSVAADAGKIHMNELGTGKPLIVKITADSQLKKMPNFPGMIQEGGPRFSGPPPAGATAGRTGGPGDISQMLERMPGAKLEELTPGQTIVVSSTQGARADQLTAIMLLANAEMLIRMVSMQSGNGRDLNSTGINSTMGEMMGGLSGFELPSIVP